MTWKYYLIGGVIFFLGFLARSFIDGIELDESSSRTFIDARAWSSEDLANSLEVNISINFDGFPGADGKPQLRLSIKNLLESDIVIPGELVTGHRSDLWEVWSLEGDVLGVRPYNLVESTAVVLKFGQEITVNPLWPNCPQLDAEELAFQPGNYLIGLSEFGIDGSVAEFELNNEGLIVSN